MYKINETLFFSPSDITVFMESPFASYMDRYAFEYRDSCPEPDVADGLSAMLQTRGIQHETELLEEFKTQSLTVVELNDAVIVEGASWEYKHELTKKAMKQGADVIYQAALEKGQFRGFADFLIKKQGQSELGDYYYEVWDTKLSSSVKPKFVMQLCCYAEMLEAMQGLRPKTVSIILSNKEQQELITNDYYYYYLAIKSEFINKQQGFTKQSMPTPADSKSFGRWTTHAEQLLKDQDHLSLVANITRSQIKKLNKAGITTMKQLAHLNAERVAGIRSEQLDKLHKQADIQLRSRGQIPPLYEILHHKPERPTGLALLPPHSKNDVFFDIEGFPLIEGGLEYLWGATYFDNDGTRQFIDFWAHDHEQEKQAFTDFIHWTYARWLDDPFMHIYHYAPYEITACKKLMGRYGVCEDEVDQLLRNNVFVDLYKVVKSGLRIGEPKYSIKNVEHLYRGARDTEVGTGGDSVAVYDAWRENPDGDIWQESQILNDIRQYNIDDCNSTQELVGWLRDEQYKQNIAYEGNHEVIEFEAKEEVTERTLLRDKLFQTALKQQGWEADLTENLAWMLEFHRREEKPVFWRKFERLDSSDEELFDDMDCLEGCTRTVKVPIVPKRKKALSTYEYCFDPTQKFKGGSNKYIVRGYKNEKGNDVQVTFIKEQSQLEIGLILLKSSQEFEGPITLIPEEHVRPEPIPTALFNQVKTYSQGLLNHSAITDFLKRSNPRIQTVKIGEPIVSSHDSDIRLNQIIEAVIHLDNSYLPIQGPPGAGKTYTAKHIIAELMKRGCKVGISSNSHKAINNLLISTAEYCQKKAIKAHFSCTSNTDDRLSDLGVVIAKNKDIVNNLQQSCVVGTTAWGFAREELKDEFDYLFIDEAGQVSVANLVAMSQSTKNIVLLGDQMQLGQPTQGTHPKDSGLSILDYLLKDSPTIQPEMGIFLETTYRMHSKVNQFISEAIYGGQLHAHPDNDKQVIEVPQDYQGALDFEAGVNFIPVEHEGNTQASDEEVSEIKKLALSLLGRAYTDKQGEQRAITLDDMLFVAPYNHQRNKLQQALGPDAKVGTVDKFQGQEAPIVFFSLCTSDASESPRGIDFLFDKHRINVAISRAQTMAIIVANPALFTTPVGTIEQMKKVNVVCQLQ